MDGIRCKTCNEINDQDTIKCEFCKFIIRDESLSCVNESDNNSSFIAETYVDIITEAGETINDSEFCEETFEASHMDNSSTTEPRRMYGITQIAPDSTYKSSTMTNNGSTFDCQKLKNVITKKKSRKRKRIIAFAWDHQTESALIAAVKYEPTIWDSASKDYKNPNAKIDSWKRVATVLNIEGVDDKEARLKWQSLRSHFKARLGKFLARKSSQATSETSGVSWTHFSEMMFIESTEVTQSSATKTTIKLESACNRNDTSILDNLTQLPNVQSPLNVMQPKPKRVRQTVRRREPSEATPTPPPSPSLSSNPCSGGVRDLCSQVVENIARRQDDRSDVFGQLVASHLRSLPEEVAFNLEGRIMQMIYSLPPKSELLSLASSQVMQVDQDKQETTYRNITSPLTPWIASTQNHLNFHRLIPQRVELNPPPTTSSATKSNKLQITGSHIDDDESSSFSE